MQTLTEMPDEFAAGTTVTYTRSVADFKATDGWVLSLYLNGATQHSFGSTASGANFIVTIPATETFKPGVYQWRERVAKAGEVHEVGAGSVAIEKDIATAVPGDMQSWEEKQLAVVEDAIAGRLSSDMQSYQIAGRAVTKIPMEELLKLRGQLARAVWQQKNPGKFGPTVLATFTPVGS